MLLFPLYTTLKDKCVLVVGGGDVAERKIELMLQASAHVRVVSPAFNETLETLGRESRIQLIRQRFDPVFLDDAWFVIAATNLTRVNAEVAQEAQSRRLFVNVVDDPVLSSVQIPAIVDRSPLVVSISSSGAAPMIARHVREQIETLVDDAMGQLTDLAQTYRNDIRRQQPCLPLRRQFYEWLIRGPVLQHLRDGDKAAATYCLENALQHENTPMPGHTIRITITSDEPGDITLHTLRALNQADVIFYDDRIHAGILSLARRDADRHSFIATLSDSDPGIPSSILRQAAQHTEAGRVNVMLTKTPPCPATPGSIRLQTNLRQSNVPKTPDDIRSGAPVIS